MRLCARRLYTGEEQAKLIESVPGRAARRPGTLKKEENERTAIRQAARTRSAFHQCPPFPRSRCGAEGQLRPPRRTARLRPHCVPAVPEADEARSCRPEVDQPRPVCAV